MSSICSSQGIHCNEGMENQSFNIESVAMTLSRCGSPPTTMLHQEDANDDGKMSKLVTGVINLHGELAVYRTAGNLAGRGGGQSLKIFRTSLICCLEITSCRPNTMSYMQPCHDMEPCLFCIIFTVSPLSVKIAKNCIPRKFTGIRYNKHQHSKGLRARQWVMLRKSTNTIVDPLPCSDISRSSMHTHYL
jgi:hypothetical protein